MQRIKNILMWEVLPAIAFNSSLDFCSLLLTYTNSLDPNQDRQNVGPDLCHRVIYRGVFGRR